MCGETPGLYAHEIAALRRAAAMAHTVAGIALTLRSGGVPLASVVPGVRTQWAGRVIWAMASLLPSDTLARPGHALVRKVGAISPIC